jgi:RNA polymerase sigma factor (sigma-70 family)
MIDEDQWRILQEGIRAGAASVRLRPEDREDVIQDAWLNALSGLPSVRRTESLGAWAFSVGRRAGLSMVRRERRRAEYVAEIERRAPTVLPLPTEPFRRRSVIEALATLPPRRRDTVLAVHYYGLRCAEVASLWGLTPGTIRRYLWDGLRQIRARLRGGVPVACRDTPGVGRTATALLAAGCALLGGVPGLPLAAPLAAQAQERIQPSPGTIRGLAFDSTRMAPLAGATVSLAGGAGQLQTDSTGTFRFEAVPAGEYSLVVSHPRIDSLGLTPILRVVAVRPGEDVLALFATPSLNSLRGLYCEGEPVPSAGRDGIVVGAVQDELTGVTQPLATIVAEWVEPDGERRSVEASTDQGGVFKLCAVPRNVPVLLQAEFFGEVQGEVVVEMGGGGFLLQDLGVRLSRPGRILGEVRDGETGDPIPSALISLAGTDFQTLTSRQGRFLFPEIPPGRYEVRLEHLAYGTQSRVVDVGSATVEVNARFSREAIELEGITVTARSARLERVGYFQRRDMKRGSAVFLSGEEVRARDSRRLSIAFFNIPGVWVRPLGPYGPQLATRSGCPIPLFLNGMHLPQGVSFESIRPEEVEAVEIYRSAGELPVRYRNMPFLEGCGALFIWTTR